MDYYIDIRVNTYIKHIDAFEEVERGNSIVVEKVILAKHTIDILDIAILAADGRELYLKTTLYDEDELKVLDKKFSCINPVSITDLRGQIIRFFNPKRGKTEDLVNYITIHKIDQSTGYAQPRLITYNNPYIIPAIDIIYDYKVFQGFPDYIYSIKQLEDDMRISKYSSGYPRTRINQTNNEAIDNVRWYKDIHEYLLSIK